MLPIAECHGASQKLSESGAKARFLRSLSHPTAIVAGCSKKQRKAFRFVEG